MHKVLIILPVVLAGCMSAAPVSQTGIEVAPPVTRAAGWAGCEAEGGSFDIRDDGGLICVMKK